jgi:hypothetical protein
MIIQLSPSIPLRTPKGNGLAHFLIDDGPESDLKWVVFLDNSGECWTYSNPHIRALKNITQGREYISPYYDPDDVAFPATFKYGLVSYCFTCKKTFECPADENGCVQSCHDCTETNFGQDGT